MLEKFDDYEIIESMRGGVGKVKIERAKNILKNIKTYARLTLFPGSSIGFHKHECDEEIIYVLSGKGELVTSEKNVPIYQGLINTCFENEFHSIRNNSTDNLVLLAVVTKC